MILDLATFCKAEQSYWKELDAILIRMETQSDFAMTLEQSMRFHYLYRRACSDLSKIKTFSSEPATTAYLERLVARSYTEIHESRERGIRLRPMYWLRNTFPQTFRRRHKAFVVSVLITVIGIVFGASLLLLDPDSKKAVFPFPHLHGDPSDRVALEESEPDVQLENRSSFAAMLMTNNIRVSMLALALGITFGLGTMTLLFYNGVILGAIMLDYILAGEGVFLAGWLLPHGSVEIPCILIAGQAGLVLGNALVGRNTRASFRDRMRDVAPDLVTLIFGVALILVWAAIVESFFSQFHAPILPYWIKITFGAIQLVLLFAYLYLSGTKEEMGEGAGTSKEKSYA